MTTRLRVYAVIAFLFIVLGSLLLWIGTFRVLMSIQDAVPIIIPIIAALLMMGSLAALAGIRQHERQQVERKRRDLLARFDDADTQPFVPPTPDEAKAAVLREVRDASIERMKANEHEEMR